MDLSEITTMLGTIVGIVTPILGAGAWKYKQQNKRLKEAEAQLAEISVDKGRIEAQKENEERLLRQIDHQQETIDKYVERYDNLVVKYDEREDKHQEELSEKTTLIRKLNADQVASLEREKDHIRKEARLEKERDHYKQWHCCREHNGTAEGCDRRKPKQPVAMKYVPLYQSECEHCKVEIELEKS